MKDNFDLTIEQKLRLLCCRDAWHTCDFDGTLPFVRVADASMGIRTPVNPKDWSDDVHKSVAYPSMQLLGCGWDIKTVREFAECVADDCLDLGCDVVLGPGINIKRSPLCGRNFEYISEDPYYAGIVAKAYIAALQSEGAGACVKHFCCNNQENNRFNQTSDLDERTMREIYIKPFEIACEAKPVSLMSSYNYINGVCGSENKKGFDILRNKFGFDGVIMSDWDAVRDRTKSAKAGLDLEMPFNQKRYEKLVEDYKLGKISESEIDACVERILDFVHKTKKLQESKKRKYTQKKRIEFTLKAARECIVLLKNNGVLPLKKDAVISACGIYGKPNGNAGLFAGGGSSKVERITPLFDVIEILEKATGNKVLYETAFNDVGADGSAINPNNAVVNAAISDINIVFAGTGANIETEGRDRTTMKLSDCQQKTIIDTSKVNKNTIVVLFAGSAIDMSDWIDKVAAVVWAGFPGEMGGDAVVDVLAGKVNPSGKLAETFPLRYEDTPAAKCDNDSVVTRYNEGLNVGYRYYDSYNIPVLFPFGYGLSYSEFEYKDLKLKTDGKTVELEYEIVNKSNIDGSEISQIYVRPLSSRVYRPNKELKGFSKDIIYVGAKASIKVVLDKTAFAYWSVGKDDWTVDDGVYEIIVGASVADEKLKAKVKIVDGNIIVL